MSESVHFKLLQAHIGLLTIDRPEVRNALDWETMHALGELVNQATAMSDLRILILTGAGGHFISGGDLRALHGANTQADARRQHDLMSEILDSLTQMPAIVIAAMNGAARGGGCEVALACDLRIAAADVTLGFAQVHMAVTPGWGGTERLTALVGQGRAMDLLLTGRILSATEAQHLGLINRIAREQQALEGAVAYAENLLTLPPLALTGVKQAVRAYQKQPVDLARKTEADIFARLWATEDHEEASAAFLEKRSAQFKGK